MPCLSLPRGDTRWDLCSTQELRGVFPQRKALKYPLSSALMHPPKRGGGSPKMSLPGDLALALQERHIPGSPTTLSGYRHPHAVGLSHFSQGSFGESPPAGEPRSLPSACPEHSVPGAAQPVPPALGTPSWEPGTALGGHWGGTGEALGEHWEDRRSSPVPHRTRTVRVSRCPADAERASPQPPGAPERVPGAQPPLAVPPGSRRSVPRGARGLAVTEPSPSRHRARLPPLHPFDVRAAQVPSAPQPAPLRPRTPSTGGSAPRCSLAVASPG